MHNEVELECRYLRWIRVTLGCLGLALLLLAGKPGPALALVAVACVALIAWLGGRLNRLQQRSLG